MKIHHKRMSVQHSRPHAKPRPTILIPPFLDIKNNLKFLICQRKLKHFFARENRDLFKNTPHQRNNFPRYISISNSCKLYPVANIIHSNQFNPKFVLVGAAPQVCRLDKTHNSINSPQLCFVIIPQPPSSINFVSARNSFN